MKAVQVDGIITTISSRKDGSLRLSLITPELTAEEKAEFMKLQSQNLKCLLNPLDKAHAPKYIIDKELENKSPSQRQRDILYVIWEKSGSSKEWEVFYRDMMDKMANSLKDRYLN